jgi:hypothetical protein
MVAIKEYYSEKSFALYNSQKKKRRLISISKKCYRLKPILKCTTFIEVVRKIE